MQRLFVGGLVVVLFIASIAALAYTLTSEPYEVLLAEGTLKEVENIPGIAKWVTFVHFAEGHELSLDGLYKTDIPPGNKVRILKRGTKIIFEVEVVNSGVKAKE